MVSLAEIARARNLPQSFLAKIFQKLVHFGVLQSFRGRRRGYALARDPGSITLVEIIESVEGPHILERCIFWNGRCSDHEPCLLHETWSQVKPQIEALLRTMTLRDLAQQKGPNTSAASFGMPGR